MERPHFPRLIQVFRERSVDSHVRVFQSFRQNTARTKLSALLLESAVRISDWLAPLGRLCSPPWHTGNRSLRVRCWEQSKLWQPIQPPQRLLTGAGSPWKGGKRRSV